MKERIQKIISAAGLMSRRAAEKYITEGRVTVNGRPAEPGQSADPEVDIIEVDGIRLGKLPDKVYIMLNKPTGYVTTMSDEQGRACVKTLVSDCPARVYPVGRLDMYSEGLLIFTNDGEAANRIMHPRFEHEKCYCVRVHGDVERALGVLNAPVELDGRRVKGKAELVSCEGGSFVLHITVKEGLNRQVRRMCAAAGLKVERLVRISEAGLELGDLPSGKWRYLTNEELKLLELA